MTTTTDYESMTNLDVNLLLAKMLKLRLDTIEAPNGFITAKPDYATSLDACREAIEKFCKDRWYFMNIHYTDNGWEVATNRMSSSRRDREYVTDKSPARAACIAMLKALEKE